MTDHRTAAFGVSKWESASRVVGDYLERFERLVEAIDVDVFLEAVDELRRVRDSGGTIYLAGNGGSAATATHWANDLGKATKRSGQPAIRVLCLTDNVSWLTALANDEGYDRVFAGQLENFARAGDVLVVISASGNSPNLIEAVALAHAQGVRTIGLLGFDGGALKSQVDVCLWLESEHGLYGPVETAHVLLCDLITTCLISDTPNGEPVEKGSGSAT